MTTTTANFGHDDDNYGDEQVGLDASGRHASDAPVDSYSENRNVFLPGNEDTGVVHDDPDLNQHQEATHETTHDVTHDPNHEGHVEGESLGEHKPGESFKEWMAADIQQTKEDLHIGKKHD